MIDQYKMYNYINWFIFSVYVSLSIIICAITNIEINMYGFINAKYISMYLLYCIPLIVSYPVFQSINDHLYENGNYYKFIERRIKNVST